MPPGQRIPQDTVPPSPPAQPVESTRPVPDRIDPIITSFPAGGGTPINVDEAFNQLVGMFPKLVNYPEFLMDVIAKVDKDNMQGRQILGYVVRRSRELGINLFSSGGGGGRNRQNVIGNFTAAIRNAAGQFGISLTPEMIAYMAQVAEAQDWSMDQLEDIVLDQATWDGLQPGTLSANVDQIKALARSHYVTLSEETIRQYARKIASGESSFDAVASLIRQTAKQLNPWMTEQIDAGMAPSDIMNGHRDRIATSLGIDPSQVDFMNPRYMKMATFTDPKTGETRLATLAELTKNIRNDPEWAKSTEARDVGSNMAMMLGKIFGRSAF